ncbi:MAG: hypothetical protein C0511_06675 [Hyphomicrobium sp.]|nr:hypothetical protein [Hyphomicrobium sp.]PPC82549.1 MAG: hypothetical protein CTY40_04560 [Hyphomicrobium sp.]
MTGVQGVTDSKPREGLDAAERDRRQRMRSIAIAVVLVMMVVVFYLATIVRLGSNVLNRSL